KLAHIEPSMGYRLIGNEVSSRDSLISRRGNAAAGSNQRPIGWIFEREVKIGECRTSARIPGSTRAHVEQVTARIEHYFTGILQRELYWTIDLQRRRQNNGHHVIAAAREITTADGLILDELDRLAVEPGFADLQLTR